MNSEISILNSDVSTLTQSNNNLISEREQCNQDIDSCKNEVRGLQETLNLLQEDVMKIKKSCLIENVCKGRFPGIRYTCNDFGEAHSDGTRLCECDDNCEVVIK